MGKYFGTDGVRGVANRELTPELAYKIGRCGGYVLTRRLGKPRLLSGGYTDIGTNAGSCASRRLIVHWSRRC